MKKYLILLCTLAIMMTVKAGVLGSFFSGDSNGDNGLFVMSDPQFEWSQFKNKKSSSMITNKGLEIVSKEDGVITSSVVELPLNVETDEFVYGALFTGPKLSENVKVGIIFDYSDSRNYKGISISKNQYNYFIVKDGIYSDVKSGLIKYKGNTYALHMSRTGDKVLFMLNGIEFAKLNRVKIENGFFGVFLVGKGKTVVSSFNYSVTDSGDVEQSTSDM